MELGSRVIRIPKTFSKYADQRISSPMVGTVVYIHPEGRYHIVEFENGLRESFSDFDARLKGDNYDE